MMEAIKAKAAELAAMSTYTPPEEVPGSRKATCLCGNSVLQITGEPLFTVLCHCQKCQILTGTHYAHDIGYAPEHVEILRGGRKFIKHPFSETLTRYHCGTCGVQLMGVYADDSPRMIVPVGVLVGARCGKDDEKFKPQYHIWYTERVADHDDSLPKWAGNKGRSERLG
mmetsp:Transcript_16466/g.49313  ORF Transcript_16466/g.49313 Transcript_16466/m.49313 type:complete len:169 (+) Transcript_16466:279-785(+)|eukprot:CAMPEP_0206142288 /NCGR_PEP_ID=MMETSP1473-20131121/16271_1 /ASSEMBLY_ACC=CAM_ASM_001109 /TAXON_ID=1461547 /ORGANISM="Stichococcus sp, Strain RCC1054" /LENGTH=168 /DNA_ID=CAMNT_0053537225 /DNA_START=264 /DNA_END=770 /DNA_ORIENTATION=+